MARYRAKLGEKLREKCFVVQIEKCRLGPAAACCSTTKQRETFHLFRKHLKAITITSLLETIARREEKGNSRHREVQSLRFSICITKHFPLKFPLILRGIVPFFSFLCHHFSKIYFLGDTVYRFGREKCEKLITTTIWGDFFLFFQFPPNQTNFFHRGRGPPHGPGSI